MTALLTGFRTRVLDILCNGRGVSGALGVPAQQRAIAANRYRPSASNAPLESLGTESFDRAVRIAPQAIGDTWLPINAPEILYLWGKSKH